MPARFDSRTVAIFCFLVGTVAANRVLAQQPKVSLGDKTLLAWVQLANLGQRGGSVLTIQDLREFDGIDRALSRDELASLKPGTRSALQPLALWSFEDGTARDEMGFFANCTLHGGAHVEHGKLHLDGTDGYLSTGTDDFTSLVPRRESYSETLPEQLEQLQTDPQVLRFAESRNRLAADPYRPSYHYVNPEGMLNDPNGLCFWQGRYHLFYQAYPPEDPRQHWGHAVSQDLIHWQDLPLAIYPGLEMHCFSGSTLVEQDRVIAMYHGTTVGNLVAVSHDPLLLNWQKIPGNPVIPIVPLEGDSGRPYRVYDPCLWKEDDRYYALSGTFWKGAFLKDCVMVQQLFCSPDLRQWTYLGPLVEGTGFTQPGEDGAVPYFWPLGDKQILLFASHQRGSQYLLGDYDRTTHKFQPFAHGRFNFGAIGPGGVHAPSATPAGQGGVYVIHNVNEARPTSGWNHLLSLPRLLTLRPDHTLGIEPVAAVETLRGDQRSVGQRTLAAGQELVLPDVSGKTLEILAEIDPRQAQEVCLTVLRSPGREEATVVCFRRQGHITTDSSGRRDTRDALILDASHASLHSDVQSRPPEVAPFDLPLDESLRLRIFVDRSLVEVFANGRQCVALRVYPQRPDSLGVSLSARGGDAVLRRLDAWPMQSIYATSLPR